MKKIIALGWVVVVMAASLVFANPPVITQQVTPGTISYQGQLQAADGSNYVDGVYGIEFRLYDAATDGTLLWGAHYQPYMKNGYFNVILGQTGVGEVAITNGTYPAVGDFWKAVWLDPNLANKNRYLSITLVSKLGVNIVTPHESFPRQQLLASPYAVQAQFAQQADSASRSLVDFSVAGALHVTSNATLSTLSVSNVAASSVSGCGTIPIGGIIMWSGGTVPAGWALCDGSTTNGQVTPDLRGRFVLGMGAGTGLTARVLGQVNGTENHILSVAELPSHSHPNTATSDSKGAHTHTYASGAWSDWGISNGGHDGNEIGRYQGTHTSSSDGGHAHDITMSNASIGSGQAHNNMPPYYVLAFIMRIK